ncbi:uncharacterized protein LOC106055150 [Biomphalaria glabrata]|uniref:Uncharacterized protein LOC106055150 n=1 Tax=Biomphalaria glabrata TaxID=6526 RepID=A0A9W2YUZ3_BIOGL|nr:uncharacterized protein LOC106055150 [Biomphalaria glabrata]
MATASYSLPPHGIPTLIPEIISKPFDTIQHKTVRVVGRVVNYDAANNLAFLAEPTQSSSIHLVVDTQLTDSSDYVTGSQVMLIGELEELDLSVHKLRGFTDSGNVILKARISKCVDRLDYGLYCKTLAVWRDFSEVHFSQ